MACAKLCNGAPPNVVCFFSYFSLYDNLVSHHLSVKRETEKKPGLQCMRVLNWFIQVFVQSINGHGPVCCPRFYRQSLLTMF